MEKYEAPAFKSVGFTCPHCGWYSRQFFAANITASFGGHIGGLALSDNDKLSASRCDKCSGLAYWVDKKLAHPRVVSGPVPHEHLPEGPKADFEEARRIAADSPRGAAALLRLSIQKLCIELGEPGKDINADIGSLVRKGLPARVQQSLDILRVIGNESVHPGTMDLQDNIETVSQLFNLVNLIVQDRIAEPKEIEKLYASLPQTKRKGIEDRDKKPVT